MKNYYFVAEYEKNGCFYAMAEKYDDGINLYAAIKDRELYGGIKMVSLTIMETNKKAYKMANFWNECFSKNGTYMYSKENMERLGL